MLRKLYDVSRSSHREMLNPPLLFLLLLLLLSFLVYFLFIVLRSEYRFWIRRPMEKPTGWRASQRERETPSVSSFNVCGFKVVVFSVCFLSTRWHCVASLDLVVHPMSSSNLLFFFPHFLFQKKLSVGEKKRTWFDSIFFYIYIFRKEIDWLRTIIRSVVATCTVGRQ